MSELNIVIVTYNWPPRNAIGTHRPYAWAKYWSLAGARVTVLTAEKQSYDEPLDLFMPPIEGVAVVEVAPKRYTGLVSKLLEIDVLRRLAKIIKSWLGRKSSFDLDPRSWWRLGAKNNINQLAGETDVVVSTFGPAASHIIGCDFKLANKDIVWIADYRDLWSQAHNVNMTEAARFAAREIELSTVVAYANFITTVSQDLASKLEALTGKPALLVPNGFDLDEESLKGRLSRKPLLPEGPVRIVHTGMIYEGHRDPTPLLDALIRLESNERINIGDVTVDFYGARVDFVKRLSNIPRYAPYIRLMGHVSRNEALEAQSTAGILLLLESSSPQARGVLTGKLFEYLVAGRPILCLGSLPEYEIGSVLIETGTGMVFGPNEYLLLDDMLHSTLSGGGLYEEYSPSLTKILKYSRRAQSLSMLHSISSMVDR